MWRCSRCGEENEPAFDACWKCLAPAPETPVETPSAPLPAPAAARSAPPAGGPVPLRKLMLRSMADMLIVLLLFYYFLKLTFVLAQEVRGWEFALVALGEVMTLAVALWRLRETRAAGEPRLPLFGGPAWRAVATGLGAGVMILVLGMLYNLMINASVDVKESIPEEDILGQSPGSVIGMVAVIVLVAPLCEELFFRAAVFGAYAGSGRAGWGCIVSSLLFAGVHFRPIVAPFYVAVGLVTAAVFLRTRSILAPMVAHAVNNAGVVAVLLFARSHAPQ